MSDLVGRLRADLRDDLDEASEQPGREVVETLVLGLVGLGWLYRSYVHGLVWLAVWGDGEDGGSIAVDYGLVSSCVVAARPRERWWLGVGSCLFGVVVSAALAPTLGLWQAGVGPALLAGANAAVLIGDPILVQVLPDAE